MRTTELIALVSQDRHVAVTPQAALWTAATVGVVMTGWLFFAGVGPRPDIAVAAGTARFLFKFVVTTALSVTGLGMLARIVRPDRQIGRWWWGLAATLTLLALAVAVELVATPQARWGTRLVGTNARLCLTLVPLLSVGPLGCLLLGLRWSAPARPDVAGAVAGLAASGMAASFYAANCIDDSPLFVAAWYPLGMGLVVAAGALIGGRVLRW